MVKALAPQGIRIPDGFALTADAFRLHYGQAPSDYPEFAEYLAGIGIDSISLNPDALAKVAMRLAAGPEES